MDKVMGGKRSYLAMKTDNAAASELISSDLKDVGNAVKKLANHAVKLGGLGFGTSFLKWVAAVAAIYLLILDRTNWKTNILTSLLIPYIFLSLPSWLFSLLRGELGKWIAIIAVVLRLFFPQHFPDWLELPGALILLIVVAPSFIAVTIRGTLWSIYLLGHWVLLAAGTHPSIWWVQELLYKEQRHFKLYWDTAPLLISSLGTRTFLSLEH
ncbi:UNVERIFIED_CONTAM: cold-regulated plasma membrane protein 2 [Sesamum angustifolium]|uniref:Cold-regulated plasma membrane protein 2 n=1 Tax=Sesamum angustifolium TaxID=2727405 RepID=A0AAW2QCL0_9LAMI